MKAGREKEGGIGLEFWRSIARVYLVGQHGMTRRGEQDLPGKIFSSPQIVALSRIGSGGYGQLY